MTDAEITCPFCGFSNPPATERCRACGARVEMLGDAFPDGEQLDERYEQEGFEWKWAGLSWILFLALQAIILIMLPRIVRAFDPQGLAGLMISAAVWFVGGIAVGFISPGRTYAEPAAGALLAVPPTIAYLVHATPAGFQPSMMAYIVFSLLGVMVALAGAFIGERLQTGGGPHTA